MEFKVESKSTVGLWHRPSRNLFDLLIAQEL